MQDGIFGPLFGPDDMRAVWSDENLVGTWLAAEVAMSRALDEAGFLEPGALGQIEAAARVAHIDFGALRDGTEKVGMPIKSLVAQVVAHGGPLTAKYFHWGATTQDILDTGQALRLKDALQILENRMLELLEVWVRMAEAHRETPMVARTNSQDASVTTWGLQVSGYAAELLRHLDRLEAARPRATQLMFGGAVGTLAALGDRGLPVRRRVAEILDLPEPAGAWNGSQDGVAEVVQLAALVLGTLVRAANDVELMGRTALRELRRRAPQGASSTMPHKTNPRDANMIQTHFQLVAMYAGQAVHLMDQVDVRAASKRVVSWRIVPESMLGAAAALERARRMFEALVVDADRMRESFAHSGGYVMSESVMFALARTIGRDAAYATVQDCLRNSEAESLQASLEADATVRAHLTVEQIAAACAPESYLGSAGPLVDEVLERARARLSAR